MADSTDRAGAESVTDTVCHNGHGEVTANVRADDNADALGKRVSIVTWDADADGRESTGYTHDSESSGKCAPPAADSEMSAGGGRLRRAPSRGSQRQARQQQVHGADGQTHRWRALTRPFRAIRDFLRDPALDKMLRRNVSTQPRTVRLNDRAFIRRQKFFDNYVSTTKYHLWSFLPVFMVRQLLRPANFYFLVVGVMYAVPAITPIFTAGRYATLGSLGFVIAVSMVKEVIEDLRRYKEDQRVNSCTVEVLNGDMPGAGPLPTWGGGGGGDPPTSLPSAKRGKATYTGTSRGTIGTSRWSGAGASVAWKDVVVGDFLLIKADECVPADVVLLGTSADDSICYVETRAIDGESNLKVKMPVAIHASSSATADTDAGAGSATTDDFDTVDDQNGGGGGSGNAKIDMHTCRTLIGEVRCEAPNPQLYEFEGNLRLNVPDDTGMPTSRVAKHSLTRDNFLPRGVILRNTEWVVGLVVFTGQESKLMMNLKRESMKTGRMEQTISRFIATLILSQVVITFVLTALYAVWSNRHLYSNDAWYLSETFSWSSVVQRFFTFFLTLSIFVPIALYVNIEIVRALQSVFVRLDDHMYCAETGTRARCRNSTLNDELGQIAHAFTDKTGTMTRNVMEFHSAFVDGDVIQQRRAARAADAEFFRLLALCHTVVPEHNADSGEIEYHAPSPDERALVNAAAENGMVLRARSSQTVTLVEDGEPHEYHLLHVLEFSSDRKRMSVVVQLPDGALRLYTKGADSVLFERIRQPPAAALASCDGDGGGDGRGEDGGEDDAGAGATAAKTTHAPPLSSSSSSSSSSSPAPDAYAHLVHGAHRSVHEFALDGLRTLVVGYRDLTRAELDDWACRYNEAFSSIDNRVEQMNELAAEIERDIELLGATAIEDQLQESVPDTLLSLYHANIKVWMLTGDKQETAINIGLSSGLLSNDMDVMVMRPGDLHDVSAQLDCTEARWRSLEVDGYSPFDKALVIGGDVLDAALSDALRSKLVAVSELARCVIACRMTPSQKAELVRSMNKGKKDATTLAVGDGANDVGMIQVAHVGVGIAGREGMEATLASDFSIGEFQFLKRLVLVHGRWFYKRNGKLVLYMIYKNAALGAFSIWFATVSAFSGAQFFDPWVQSMYNLFLTSIPIIVLATLDQELSSAYVLFYPEIYRSGQRNTSSKLSVFAYWIFTAFWQSVVMFYIPYYARVDGPVGDGQMMGKDMFQMVSFTILVLVVHAQLAIYQARWTLFSALLYLFSCTFWLWLGVAFCTTTFTTQLKLSPMLYWVAMRMYSEPLIWLIIVVCTVICVAPPLAVHHWNRIYFPSPKVIVQELEWAGILHNKRRPVLPTDGRAEPQFVQMQRGADSGDGRGGAMEAVAYDFGGGAFAQEDNAARHLSHTHPTVRRARLLRRNLSDAQAVAEAAQEHNRFASRDGSSVGAGAGPSERRHDDAIAGGDVDGPHAAADARARVSRRGDGGAAPNGDRAVGAVALANGGGGARATYDHRRVASSYVVSGEEMYEDCHDGSDSSSSGSFRKLNDRWGEMGAGVRGDG